MHSPQNISSFLEREAHSISCNVFEVVRAVACPKQWYIREGEGASLPPRGEYLEAQNRGEGASLPPESGKIRGNGRFKGKNLKHSGRGGVPGEILFEPLLLYLYFTQIDEFCSISTSSDTRSYLASFSEFQQIWGGFGPHGMVRRSRRFVIIVVERVGLEGGWRLNSCRLYNQ